MASAELQDDHEDENKHLRNRTQRRHRGLVREEGVSKAVGHSLLFVNLEAYPELRGQISKTTVVQPRRSRARYSYQRVQKRIEGTRRPHICWVLSGSLLANPLADMAFSI